MVEPMTREEFEQIERDLRAARAAAGMTCGLYGEP